MKQNSVEGFCPIKLTVEYLTNPLGIETEAPRFSWMAVHPRRGEIQSACRIWVASREELLTTGNPDMWDSGEIAGSCSTLIEYRGKPLASRTRYYWQVHVRDSAGGWSSPSEIGWFEMGLLSDEEWHGEWIGVPQPVRGRAPLFRHEFSLSSKPARGRAYVCGLGYFELHVNGQRIGNNVLEPAWTDYTKRVLYVTHDITQALRGGDNVIGIILGEGWYGNDHPALIQGGTHRAAEWTGFPKLLLEAVIELIDGSTKQISTKADGSWIVSESPIIFNSIYDGETYDARKEQRGWDRPNFKAKGQQWYPAVKVTEPGGSVHAQQIEPIQVIRQFVARSITALRNGSYLYDFGQNMAGWVRLKVKGRRGTKVTMRFGESLSKSGSVNQENLRMARATDTYILKGKGIEIWEPHFTYHGFRYVELEGFPGVPDEETLVACEVRSSIKPIGHFECSNALLNRIHSCVQWTECSNMHGVPTDCPQRDERMGWLNDMTVRTEEMLYNFYVPALLSKFEQDIIDTQDQTGAIADTAPYVWGSRPADAVCSSFLLVPWYLYVNYGDRRILDKSFEHLKAWQKCLARTICNGIVQHSLYGDWASPAPYCADGKPWSSITSGQLMSTGYFYLNARLLSAIAIVLGKDDEAAEFSRQADEIASSFNKEYFHSDSAQYAQGSQASNAFAVFLGIVPKNRRADVVQNILKDIEKRDYHLTTGNLCSRYILDVLSENGHVDVAYRLATQTTYPSWGYMIESGATTIWERWEAATGDVRMNMHSWNHPMYCSIDAWFYRILAGIIPDPSAPAYERFDIKPYLPNGLRYVDAAILTPRGSVRSYWQRWEDVLLLHVTVPFNSICRIWVPGESGATAIYEGETPIWDKGNFTPSVAGILDCEVKEERVVFTVGSGGYCFKIIRKS